jgi:hypothetical protein
MERSDQIVPVIGHGRDQRMPAAASVDLRRIKYGR